MVKIHKRIKKKVWKILEPAFPHIRDFFVKTRLVWHKPGRQPWHLGWLKEGIDLEHFKLHLNERGFNNHYIAWIDDGEVLGVRRGDGEKHQYHLRVFHDGEVRVHHEITPEEDTVKHMLEIDMVPKKDHFLEFIGEGWIEFREDKGHQDYLPFWERFMKKRVAKKLKI